MSWLSKLTGGDAVKRAQQSADTANAQLTTAGQADSQRAGALWSGMTGSGPQVGQAALTSSIQAAMSAAMPQFQTSLQGVREGAVRRGLSTGDLGTTAEGDLASAFQQHIADAAGSQAMGLYQTNAGLYDSGQNRYLDVLAGNRDYQQADANAKRQRRAGTLGAIGAAAGGYFGGPAGAQIGASLGSNF